MLPYVRVLFVALIRASLCAASGAENIAAASEIGHYT